MVVDKVVCERWCVTKLYVKDGCERREEAGGGGGGRRRHPGYRIKNKNPTQSCGEIVNGPRPVGFPSPPDHTAADCPVRPHAVHRSMHS